MKTALDETIHWIKTRMSMFPENPVPSERGAYDAYLNVLEICISKKTLDKQQIIDAWNNGDNSIEPINAEEYYIKTYTT